MTSGSLQATMPAMDTTGWERRWHPLRQEWVVLAAHRNTRPWSGAQAPAAVAAERYRADCYLCPGNARVSGARNPAYDGIFVFDNDHPCVGPLAPVDLPPATGIYRRAPATGIARVVCYAPEHDLRLAQLPAARVDALYACWQDQERELATRPGIEHVLIFENNGEAVGVSNPHPHCQIYAAGFTFRTVEVMIDAERRHRQETGRQLFGDIIAAERADGVRLLGENAHAIAFVPWFARYAYEVYAAPKRRVPGLAGLTDVERGALAELHREVLVRFDNLWRMPFPYVMAVHQAPLHRDRDDVHCHVVFHPPLRRPGLIKYLAGPEVGGGTFVADTLPERTAGDLRAVSGERHYRES